MYLEGVKGPVLLRLSDCAHEVYGTPAVLEGELSRQNRRHLWHPCQDSTVRNGCARVCVCVYVW